MLKGSCSCFILVGTLIYESASYFINNYMQLLVHLLSVAEEKYVSTEMNCF